MFCPSVEKNHIQKEDALRCNQAMIEVDVEEWEDFLLA